MSTASSGLPLECDPGLPRADRRRPSDTPLSANAPMPTRALLAVLLLSLLAPAPAEALLVPLREQAGSLFPVQQEEVHVSSLLLRITRPVDEATAAGSSQRWLVEAELAVRNRRNREVEANIGLIVEPAYASRATVHARGVPIDTTRVQVLHDPRLRQHHHPEAVRFTLPLGPLDLVTVHLRTIVSARTDETGQTWLELPLHALGLFDDVISHAWIRLEADERMLGFRASLTDWTYYDAPENAASWFVRDWEIRRPLQIAWIGAWPLLLRMATIEDCPTPWELMQRVAAGRAEELRGFLGALDPDTREFCAGLPLVVHGNRFRSEETRERLGELRLSRYVPNAPDNLPIYVVNPAFTREGLTDVERIYMDTLSPR